MYNEQSTLIQFLLIGRRYHRHTHSKRKWTRIVFISTVAAKGIDRLEVRVLLVPGRVRTACRPALVKLGILVEGLGKIGRSNHHGGTQTHTDNLAPSGKEPKRSGRCQPAPRRKMASRPDETAQMDRTDNSSTPPARWEGSVLR